MAWVLGLREARRCSLAFAESFFLEVGADDFACEEGVDDAAAEGVDDEVDDGVEPDSFVGEVEWCPEECPEPGCGVIFLGVGGGVDHADHLGFSLFWLG